MFSPSGSGYFSRPQGDGRMRDIPGLTRRRTPGVRSPLSDAWSPSPRTEWDAGYFARNIPSSSRFVEVDDYPLPRSTPLNDAAYPNSTPPIARNPYAEQQVPFEQATANMHAALQHACRECPKMDKSFHEQTQRLTVWLPPPLLNPLWTIFLDWNGIPLQQHRAETPISTKPRDLPTAPQEFPAFNEIAQRFTAALKALKMSAPPSCFTAAGNGNVGDVNLEVLRTTMRKLQISLEAIESLIGSVRNHRDRMRPLVMEMSSAVALLEGMREVWDVKGKKRATTPQPTGRQERKYEFWEEAGDI